ncbi:MAG: threonine/serine exporter family protein, partial [Gemmiger sp.]
LTFEVPSRHFVACGITGALGWLVYSLCVTLGGLSAPMATLVATLPLTAAARFYSIRHKAPITLFLLSGIFPLVPGAGIYYTAYYLLQGNRVQCTNKGVETLKIALALALGIALVCSLPLPGQQHRKN